MPPEPDFTTIQATLGLTFDDLSLLKRALTHPSYLNENPSLGLEDNERLEFLGDAVLDYISATWLYHRYPEMSEGELTRLRAALVRTEMLAQFARDTGIDRCVLLGHGLEETGGRSRNSVLCDAFEALVGALCLDKGFEAAANYVKPLFQPALADIMDRDLDKDAKSLLQEWSQAKLGLTPTYKTISERGPDHAKEFTVSVLIGNEVYGQGVGRNKQAAAQKAARSALDNALQGQPPSP